MTIQQIEARRENILSIIKSAGATFLAVEFFKKDGTARTMQVQLPAIQKHLVGDAASDSAKQGVDTRKANHPELLPVFDVAKGAIRSINLDTLFAVTVRGTRFDVGLPLQS
jgi:hypothetical protein